LDVLWKEKIIIVKDELKTLRAIQISLELSGAEEVENANLVRLLFVGFVAIVRN